MLQLSRQGVIVGSLACWWRILAGEEPPQNEVDDSRVRIVSDPYFNLGLTGGYIGLLVRQAFH